MTFNVMLTRLGILVLVLALNIWFWFNYIPQHLFTMIQEYEAKKAAEIPTVEEYIEQGYDTYEYEGDWGEYLGDHDTTTMPRPLLECEAGDHTCID